MNFLKKPDVSGFVHKVSEPLSSKMAKLQIVLPVSYCGKDSCVTYHEYFEYSLTEQVFRTHSHLLEEGKKVSLVLGLKIGDSQLVKKIVSI